ncbi:MAG TPA: glutathione peroxidase [Sandaracinaceae bacterium LLY-WYZ-13_1]|nr:glutathione peroxidase [Sandaracinaceae bacterium LLY-WYZ-13_1]
MTTLHDFTMKTIDGDERSLEDYAGKAVLVVNVASECGLTPQYEGLEKLHETYGDRGLAVLGFPCNQFGAQEPGTEAEIKEFCTSNYGVEFPMFAKIEVNGDGAHPLYQWLKAETIGPDDAGEIPWNFAKFLVGKDGRVLARFSPKAAPDDAQVVQAIEKALP